MNILIGTSGYHFRDWRGPFYPECLPDRDMLTFYADYFNTLELNVTYYQLPSIKSMDNIACRTPEDFNFWIKAHNEMTHTRGSNPDIFTQFRECVKPMQDRGTLRGVLAQFPYSFKGNRENASYLREMRERLEGFDLAVEFRHDSWIKPKVFDFLQKENITYCIPDEPKLPGLVPPTPHLTSNIGYIRLHGRNSADWWGEGGDRYDYNYSDQELEEWLTTINELATAAKVIYVLFNNCHLGQAVRNALKLQEMLESLASME